jgi:hypothetical protein
VTIDDGTDRGSMDFVLYLIRRADGWTVWGMYEDVSDLRRVTPPGSAS